jgi:uncharacterized protein
MRFEWDPRKAELNLKKHGISFEIAQLVFDDPLALSIPDHGHSDKEERWITMGIAGTDKLIVVVIHTYRDTPEEEVQRIISARKTTPKERKQYTNLPERQR